MARVDRDVNREESRIRKVYDSYELNQKKWSLRNRGNRAIYEERARLIKWKIETAGMLDSSLMILDIGCGDGNGLQMLRLLGYLPNNLFGIDLLEDRIGRAKEQYPDMHFKVESAAKLQFARSMFDIVVLFTVLSSILDEDLARRVTQEAHRVLKPGGAVLWYDFRFNNPFNRNVRGIPKRKIETYFPGYRTRLRTITLLPPLARRLGYFTRFLYPILSAVPFLRTHWCGLLWKNGSDGEDANEAFV